ncbi:MAG: hypothetical protein H7338_06750 [Candidatus Sericytochromatia bacterium]|nr:hypothetical protein [Candidatus Sericytochromatia bacterium]
MLTKDMVTTATNVPDPKLIPPQIMARVFHDLDLNRDFDMGGYSVPTIGVFEQLAEVTDRR